MSNPLDPGAPITYGRDFNFFQNVTVTASIGAFNADADVIITFPTYTVTFMSTGALEYSFNGNTVHGDMNMNSLTTSNILTFQNRQISKIWFRGTGLVRVEAWGIR
jgi:hypothetical protein